MSRLTSTVSERVQKAEAFTQVRLGAPNPDWQAVITFYAALHWVGACYQHQTGQPPPSNHRRAGEVYGTPGNYLPRRVFLAYRDLQSYSETARYELGEPFTPEEAEFVEDAFLTVHEWARRTLGLPL